MQSHWVYFFQKHFKKSQLLNSSMINCCRNKDKCKTIPVKSMAEEEFWKEVWEGVREGFWEGVWGRLWWGVGEAGLLELETESVIVEVFLITV